MLMLFSAKGDSAMKMLINKVSVSQKNCCGKFINIIRKGLMLIRGTDNENVMARVYYTIALEQSCILIGF